MREHVLPPDPLAAPVLYARRIGRLAERLGVDLLLPVTDASVEALLECESEIPEHVALPLPDLSTYRAASDKVAMLRRAEAAGLAVPDSLVIGAPADPIQLPRSWFPGVVKPHRSVARASGGNGDRRKYGVAFVDTEVECRAVVASLPAGAFPVILQRRVRGPGVGLFLLRWEGRIVAAFAHRRLREQPPAGGVSVYRESIAIDPALLEAGRRLLDDLDWRGVAMVECKLDPETGRYVFMEVNGRLWGSLQLALDAGVDFPGLLVACARGDPVVPTNGYRVGVRSRWLWGDVDHLYLRLTRSNRVLHLDPDAPSRFAAIRDFLRMRPGRDRSEIWRWRDPGPFIVETLRWFGVVR
ncbi:MAG: ATP-grasp domain-containing protein [Gemmatimonadetes bacterium]|nr:ATP-grasp domain-containing protein [Gemmatimonadota bacterium]